MSAHVRARLDALLAIEEVLGAAAIDATGQLESCINLAERDATALYRLISFAVDSFNGGGAGARAPSFATFALREGQIAFSGTRRRALIILADADIQARTLKPLLHEVLADLALDDDPTIAPSPAPPVPLG